MALLMIVGTGGGGRAVPSVVGAAGRAGPVTVYVANSLGNTVTPIRADGNKPGRPIRVGGPGQIVISPDGQTAYVVGGPDIPGQPSPATLTAIGVATNKPGKTLTVCRNGRGGAVIAITPDGTTVYVGCPDPHAMFPVDAPPPDLPTPAPVPH